MSFLAMIEKNPTCLRKWDLVETIRVELMTSCMSSPIDMIKILCISRNFNDWCIFDAHDYSFLPAQAPIKRWVKAWFWVAGTASQPQNHSAFTLFFYLLGCPRRIKYFSLCQPMTTSTLCGKDWCKIQPERRWQYATFPHYIRFRQIIWGCDLRLHRKTL